MEEQSFVRWVELPEAQPVRFGDLPGLMAGALHDSDFAQVAAEINFTAALKKMVDAGELMVRDPLTFGRHTFPIGDALRRAVLLPREDLRPLLAAHSIGLRLIPYGTGPTHWTIENSAVAIAAQEGWHQGARDTLRGQMVQAVADGTLTVRHPHTALAYRPDAVRDFRELVTPADVNEWLALDSAGSLRWLHAAHEPKPSPGQAPAVTGDAPLPLTTGDIAFCFDGLRWSETEWKKPLGDKPKWLQACIAIPGRRGVSETRWNPVLIGGALVSGGYVPANRVRARFQTRPLLAPWLDAWKTYEADQIESA